MMLLKGSLLKGSLLKRLLLPPLEMLSGTGWTTSIASLRTWHLGFKTKWYKELDCFLVLVPVLEK